MDWCISQLKFRASRRYIFYIYQRDCYIYIF